MVMPVRGQVTRAAGSVLSLFSTKFWSKPLVLSNSGAPSTSPSRVGLRRSQGVPATARSSPVGTLSLPAGVKASAAMEIRWSSTVPSPAPARLK